MNDIVDRANAALAGVTPGPWTHHIAPSENSDETPAQYCANTLVGNGDPVHVLTAASPDPKFAYIVPALTGDGPTSAINADFIAQARDLVPELIAEVERVRSACKALGEVLHSINRMVLDITGLHHMIDDESGDGDWAAVWETLAAGYGVAAQR